MKVSLIVTVFNEIKSIDDFLKSVLSQSRIPDELIIVDGNSTDGTVDSIKNYELKAKKSGAKFKLFIKKGNRAIGRNEAIKNSSNEIIVCSDSGCVLDKDWIKNIIVPFNDSKVDVVAGYYRGVAKSIFEKCLIPYVLVMPDKIDEKNFLPATRSIAFRKPVWKKAGGFPEEFSNNEDYVFARKLKQIGANIVFKKNAVVYWKPRKTLKEAFKMFFRFAFGDAEAKILRSKVILLIERYTIGAYLIAISFLLKSQSLLTFVIFAAMSYLTWSVLKNYGYVKDKSSFIVLPILQLTSDAAILMGTTLGFVKSLIRRNCLTTVKNNYPLLILLAVYIAMMIFVISAGLPNENHPFTYQMDEWHQAQAVRAVYSEGSPNIPGSANGTIFHFFITGILLVPFYAVGLINPFAIKSSVDSLADQERLFIILRFTTLFFGILTLAILPKISRLLRLNTFAVALLFTFTPAWLVLSNFFKYDIALIFWITLSFYYFIKYGFCPDIGNFLLGCFFSGVAFAVKVSALPLLLIIFLAFFLFTPLFNKKYLYLLLGISVFIFNAMLLGIPDIIFGGKNMYAYLYENIIGSMRILENYTVGNSLLDLTLMRKLPAIFGHVLYGFSILAFFYVSILALIDFKNKKYNDFKIKLFVLLSFLIFCLSLIPLGITISANRSLVLLPFMAIISGILLKSLSNTFRKRHTLKFILTTCFLVVISAQIFESYIWFKMKIFPSPQELSSKWIIKNISGNSSIGLENIPIYQFEPDFILKEFYSKQYHPGIKTKYNYFIVSKDAVNLPEYIVLSNVDYENRFLRISPKNDLVKRLKKEKYIKVAYFPLRSPSYYPYLGLFAYPDGISVYRKR